MSPLHLSPALLLLALASPAFAAPEHCTAKAVSLRDIPLLVTDLRAQALDPKANPPCPDYVLRVPIDWAEDADGAILLSGVETPYAAVDLTQIALRDPAGRISRLGRFGYSATPGQPVPRPRPRTAAEIEACRAALLPYADDLCDTPAAQFAVEIDNPDDIALARRLPVTPAQRDRARVTGLFVQVAFRLQTDGSSPTYANVESVDANLTGLTIVDASGAVLAAGQSSDLLPQREAKAKPRWLTKPSGQYVSRVYPDRAMRYNIGGRVVISCRVGHLGWLRRCEAVSETPPDYNFGDAAKRLGPFMQAAPLVDGEDFIGATVRVPISFATPESEGTSQPPPPGPDGGPPPGVMPSLAPAPGR